MIGFPLAFIFSNSTSICIFSGMISGNLASMSEAWEFSMYAAGGLGVVALCQCGVEDFVTPSSGTKAIGVYESVKPYLS